jgi:hypothetical protein
VHHTKAVVQLALHLLHTADYLASRKDITLEGIS